jgi:hypothetical protein
MLPDEARNDKVEMSCEEVVESAALVIVPSPPAGEGSMAAQETLIGEGALRQR